MNVYEVHLACNPISCPMLYSFEMGLLSKVSVNISLTKYCYVKILIHKIFLYLVSSPVYIMENMTKEKLKEFTLKVRGLYAATQD